MVRRARSSAEKVEHAFWVVLGVLPVLSASGASAVRTFWQEQAGTLIGFLVSANRGGDHRTTLGLVLAHLALCRLWFDLRG
jgi:hypothetical protein